jgi:DNA-binding GntR family transcriptional regulator
MSVGIPFKSVSEMLTDTLREAILSRELVPGEVLRQRSLAQRYHVSEVVVREALRSLDGEGLVQLERRRGARVSNLSADEIDELCEIRILVEHAITRHAVPRCTAHDLRDAEQLLRAMDEERNPVKWLALDREFHHSLYRPGQRLRLNKMATDLRQMLERYLRFFLGSLHMFEPAQKEHRDILEAYRSKNVALAKKCAGKHLRRTADTIVKHLKAHGGLDIHTEAPRNYTR